MKSRLEFEKTVPEVGDLIIGTSHHDIGEIVQISRWPGGNYGIRLYRLKCIVKGSEKNMVVPHLHFNWVGDHWVLSNCPYRIEVEKPLSLDWFVTDPESQTTRSVIAPSAEAAVTIARQESHYGINSDSVCVGQLHSVSVRVDGTKLLRQFLLDIDNKENPSSPFRGLGCSEGGRAQLTAQMAGMRESRIARFSQRVEEAFDELTCGHGFWWMLEGRTDLHCTQCSNQIPACVCPHGSNDNDTSE
jgi:hypothetical protein